MRLLIKKQFLYPVLIVSLIFLLLPQTGKALIMDEITALFTAMGDGTEDMFNPIAAKLLDIFLWYAGSLAGLYISAFLLQHVLLNSPTWLTVNGSTAAWVQSGWNFTAGITNAFLILILLVIAFAYILKIESIQAKKALPRLIIVALLVNFSLVFVGLIIDISNVLYRTVITAAGGVNANFIFDVVNLIGGNGWQVMLSLIAFLVTIVVALIIPFSMPFVEMAITLGVVSVIFLPSLILWIVQIILFAGFAGIFFILTFLLAARVFVIQILAVISPLAFACAVLPQTKKYWDEWLEHLVQWSLYGVVVFFFLLIGVKAMRLLSPPTFTTFTALPGVGFFSIMTGNIGFFAYYFFLFIYLFVIKFVADKFSPMMAKAIIAQAEDFTKKIGGQVGGLAKATIKKRKEEAQGDLVSTGDRGNQRIAERLERTPLIGGAFGGPGAYQARQRKIVDADKKKMGFRSDESIQEIMVSSSSSNRQKAAANAVAAERGLFKGNENGTAAEKARFMAEIDSIKRTQDYGLDIKPVLKVRPDFSQKLGKNIGETVKGISAPDTVKIQKEAMSHPEVIIAISSDEGKINTLKRRGSQKQKKAIYDGIETYGATAIAAEAKKLKDTTGKTTQEIKADLNKLRELRENIKTIRREFIS